MKRILFTLFTILFSSIASAQVSIIADVTSVGGLSNAITAAGGNANTITNLTVTGNIDARDVKFMRDNMPVLAVLDIERVQIKAYNGSGGTSANTTYYPANQMPCDGFFINGNSEIKLTGIKLPASLTTIGSGALQNCFNLTSVTIPGSVTTIGSSAFGSCRNLMDPLVIPSSVKSIEQNAFSGCSGIRGTLTLPNSVSSYGDMVFDGCRGFTGTLFIPSSMTKIPVISFQGCSGFNSLVLSNNITTIEYDAFNGCTGFTGDLIIPNSVTSITDGFRYCSGFTSCYIPNSVTSIKSSGKYYGTFSYCTSLKKVATNKIVPLTIDTSTFQGVNKTTCELIVPMGSKPAYQAATGWSLFRNITEAIFVSLDTRGGNPAAPITTTLANTTIVAPGNPTRDGHSFAGWYKEAACINAWNFDNDIVNTPITLYAKWTINAVNSFTVTFNVNGGSAVADIVATSNTSIAEPTAPNKTGHSFIGWYKEAAGVNAWNFATDVVTANTELYAKWSSPTSIDKQTNTSLEIYPNPATSTLYLVNLPQDAGIGIFSMDGKLVQQKKSVTNDSEIDVSNLPKGIYMLTINSKEGNLQQKFIKQ